MNDLNILLFQSFFIFTAFFILWVVRLLSIIPIIRRFFRPIVIRNVKNSIPIILWIQKRRNKFLDRLMMLSDVMVSIEFYITFLPSLFWCGHFKFAYHLTILLALGIYTGNGLKDVICAPRPFCPPVTRVKTSLAFLEYGWPSTHASNIIIFSIYSILYLIDLNRSSGKISFHFLVSISFILAFLSAIVIYGRLYLGMHSLIDIIFGIIIGVFVTVTYASFSHIIDNHIQSGKNVEIFQFFICLLLSYSYPRPLTHNPGFEDHTCFNGVILGVVCGTHQTYDAFLNQSNSPLPFASSSFAIGKRLVIGFSCILAVKILIKFVSMHVFPVVFTLLRIPIRSSSYIKYLKYHHKKQTHSHEENHDYGHGHHEMDGKDDCDGKEESEKEKKMISREKDGKGDGLNNGNGHTVMRLRKHVFKKKKERDDVKDGGEERRNAMNGNDDDDDDNNHTLKILNSYLNGEKSNGEKIMRKTDGRKLSNVQNAEPSSAMLFHSSNFASFFKKKRLFVCMDEDYLDVDICIRFSSYACVGYSVTVFVPMLFEYLCI